MDTLNNIISVVNNLLWTYILIALLLVIGLTFTLKSNFVQFKYFKEMFRLLGEGTSKKGDKNEVSSFQAFCISTASRVGTGNLAGIAIAISIGGPGSVFWMWLIAIIGSATSFVESTLAQIYKVKDNTGAFRGGPAYYMEKALNKKWLGVLFSIIITITFGLIFNSVQSNTITSALNQAFDINTTILAIALTIFTAIIIFGGIQRIAKFTEIIVPIMAGSYILISLFIVIMNFNKLPGMFALIFENAFGFKEAIAGGIGAAMMQGIKRGLFSNEAGMGSAPNAAATATVSHPVKQGLIQTLGVFTDTLLICSCSAFIILLSDIDLTSGATGIELTQNALSSHVGAWGTYFIAFAVLLFAFSSIIGNYYYGQSNIEFLTNKKIYLVIYRLCVIAMVFFGCISNMNTVWNLADVFMGIMAILNLVTLIFIGKFAFMALDDYRKQKESGIKNPVFKASSIPELKNVEEWK